VSSARAPTGLTVPFSGSPVDEYRFTLRLSAPVTLAAGIYWIAIANDSTGQEGDFVLEFGAVDLDHGRAGSAVSTTGAVWFANVTNFGLQIPDVLLFIDGFEAGDTLAWSAVQP
jgi:hypothetical protein